MKKPFAGFCAMIIVMLLAGPVYAQVSTSGPEPPPGMHPGLVPPPGIQVVIPGVPAYMWHHGCGPTAEGMVIGYYDGGNYPLLVPGPAAAQNAAVDAMIADDSGNPNCDAPDGDHYQDYSCPIDATPNAIAPDKSSTGGAHASNCVADHMQTSWSSRNLYYGWSFFTDVPIAFVSYVKQVAPQYKCVATNAFFGAFSWAQYRAEINAGRPVVLLVDSDEDGDTDHFVTGIGYNDTGTLYGIYNTWDGNIHWYQWAPMEPGRPFGIYGVTLFRFQTPPAIPTLTEWGMIIMFLMMMASGVWFIVRHRRRMVTA